MRSVVVTGASTGIGWAAVKVLSREGFHVFGSVRKSEDAERLKTEFGERFTPLIFDVTDHPVVRAAAAEVAEALDGETLAGLVNNAGIAVGGPLAHIPVDEFRRQLEVNLVGPLVVSQAFLPLLGMDRTRIGAAGRIVNISSVSGKIAAPFVGPYAASKHGLEALSESMRRELMLYGIDVIIVGPGAVATPIWDKAEEADMAPYAATDYAPALRKFHGYMQDIGRKGVPAEVIGEVICEALTAPRPKWRYATVRNKLVNWFLPQLLPRRRVDAFFAKQLGLTS